MTQILLTISRYLERCEYRRLMEMVSEKCESAKGQRVSSVSSEMLCLYMTSVSHERAYSKLSSLPKGTGDQLPQSSSRHGDRNAASLQQALLQASESVGRVPRTPLTWCRFNCGLPYIHFRLYYSLGFLINS